MAKKTKFMRVLGRNDYVVIPVKERIKDPNTGKPVYRDLTVLDFSK